MEKMDHYPELRRAVPINALSASRTSRILYPGIVFATVLFLATASITGIVVGVLFFDCDGPLEAGESAVHVFALIAVSF